MTTAKTLIDAAWSRSTYNEQGLATPGEMIGAVSNRLRQLYSLAARLNPLYFGDRLEVPFDPVLGGWPRPSQAEKVVTIFYAATATEVGIVPYNDRLVLFAPRVYEFGRAYFSVGTSADPTAENLIFNFSRRHPALDQNASETAEANTLDESWPEQFNDLLIIHLAKYLAMKDQRAEEVTALAAEEAALMSLFQEHVEGENHGQASRWDRDS